MLRNMKCISRVEQDISLVRFAHSRDILANTRNKFHIFVHPCIKGLLTECEVYTGKYLLRFSYRTTKERGLYEILSRTDRANEVNKTFITWLLVHFLLSL